MTPLLKNRRATSIAASTRPPGLPRRSSIRPFMPDFESAKNASSTSCGVVSWKCVICMYPVSGFRKPYCTLATNVMELALSESVNSRNWLGVK